MTGAPCYPVSPRACFHYSPRASPRAGSEVPDHHIQPRPAGRPPLSPAKRGAGRRSGEPSVPGALGPLAWASTRRVLRRLWQMTGNSPRAAQAAVRTRLRLGFRWGQRPRLRLRGRYGPRLRLGFRRRQRPRLRPGFRWRRRRLRPWSGRRPRWRRRVRRSRPWRLLRVRDRRWLHWFGPRRFRWYWLGRGGIVGYFAGGRYGRAGEVCWHLEMIPGRVLATRRGGSRV